MQGETLSLQVGAPGCGRKTLAALSLALNDTGHCLGHEPDALAWAGEVKQALRHAAGGERSTVLVSDTTGEALLQTIQPLVTGCIS